MDRLESVVMPLSHGTGLFASFLARRAARMCECVCRVTSE